MPNGEPSSETLAARVREHLEPLRGWSREGDQGEHLEPVWDGFCRRAGALGAVVPPEDGGSGEGLLGLGRALEEMGATGLNHMLPVLTAVCTVGIARHGRGAARARLPRIAAGEHRLCFAVTEPEAGFNTFRTATRARRQGDGFVLDGAKIYISCADLADEMLVLVRTRSPEECAQAGLPRTAGLSLLLVPPAAQGVTATPMATRGEGALRQFVIEFEGVEVPAANLVGDEDRGFGPLLDLINAERVLVSAMVVGLGRYCLGLACAAARGRKVFGDTPIGAYQAIQHPLAEVRVRQEALALVVREAALAFDQGSDPRRAGFLSNVAKFHAAELAAKALDAATHALGGRAFDERHGLIQLLDFVHLLKIAPISAELILSGVAEYELGLPRSY